MAFVIFQMAAMFYGTMRQLTIARRDAQIESQSEELSKKNEKLALLTAENLKRDIELKEQIIARIPEENFVSCGPIMLNTLTQQVFVNNAALPLTQMEFTMLLFFISHENETVSREQLYENVWQQPLTDSDKALKTGVSRLRKKLEESGYVITAVRGKGYRFEKKAADTAK